jgi:UDP-glucose 4-epimerase
VAKVNVPVEFAAKRPGEQQRSCLKIDKSKRVLGWSPKVDLDAGLAETYAWFKQRG